MPRGGGGGGRRGEGRPRGTRVGEGLRRLEERGAKKRKSFKRLSSVEEGKNAYV